MKNLQGETILDLGQAKKKRLSVPKRWSLLTEPRLGKETNVLGQRVKTVAKKNLQGETRQVNSEQ